MSSNKIEACPRCGVDLEEFIDNPCIECAFQFDPNEPMYDEELNFEDSYLDAFELEDFADVYDRVARDYNEE